MKDYFDYHINTALELIGDRTGPEAAKVHALLAVAYAVRATTHTLDPVRDSGAIPSHDNMPDSTSFPHFNKA